MLYEEDAEQQLALISHAAEIADTYPTPTRWSVGCEASNHRERAFLNL